MTMLGRYRNIQQPDPQLYSPPFESFERTCHSLFAIAIAWIGAVVTRQFQTSTGQSETSDGSSQLGGNTVAD